MAETEKLRIEAEFDTSKLDSKADKSLGNIKNKAKDATNALKEIGSTADNVADKVSNGIGKSMDEVANKTKKATSEMSKFSKSAEDSLKSIKAMQVMHIASQGLGRLGSAFGGTMAGGIASGAAAGIGMGAPLGPLGAAFGGIAGGIIGAGQMMSKAAELQWEAARAMKEAAVGKHQTYKDELDALDASRADAIRGKKYNGLTLDDLYAERRRLTSKINRAELDYRSAVGQGDWASILGADEMNAANATTEKARSNWLSLQKDFALLESTILKLQAAEEERANRIKKWQEEEAKLAAPSSIDENTGITGRSEAALKLSRNKSILDANSSLLNVFSQMGDFRISDSLARIGGGNGYGDINNSVNQNIAKIVRLLTRLVQRQEQAYNSQNAAFGSTAWAD